jgi:anaerobic selenocysteine-containing dehydrogenase
MLDATGRRGPERMLDVMLRTGPYGDGFGAHPAGPGHPGLSLDALIASPHGIDLGPLEPRLPEVLRTPSGRIELTHPALMADLGRLAAAIDAAVPQFALVGRRDLRSNNSWMHNVNVLVKGKERCTLQIHPDDAATLGVAHGDPVEIRSRVGKVVAPVSITADIRCGVVSLPHGWGHDTDGAMLSVASQRPGVNSNILADDEAFDPLSGNAVLNAIPVTLTRA